MPGCGVRLLPVFVTDADTVGLGPWVPAVDDAGAVAFTAVQANGATCVVRWDQQGTRIARAVGPIASFTSHPDFDGHGRLVVYGTLVDGRTALLRLGEDVDVLAASGPAWMSIGPTGPTAHMRGGVAFRATRPDGGPAAGLWRNGVVSTIVSLPPSGRMDGLPVVDGDGRVAVRVTAGAGRVLVVHDGETRVAFDEAEHGTLGGFPGLADDGAVGVAVVGPGGATYRVEREGVYRDAVPAGRFDAVRGGLLVQGGLLAVYVTPAGQAPAVLHGPVLEQRLVGIGDTCLGSVVDDFALNPVSGSDSGWLAVRVRLADGRGAVLRTEEPIEPW